MNKIALIGRQNVGKSSLFNCLTKEKISISIDYPGYTRDRIYKNIKIQSKIYTIIDTPGISFQKKEIDLLSLKQTWKAIKEANIILLLLDAKTGLTNLDISIIKNIKKTKKNILYIINKIDEINKYEKLNIQNEFKIKSPFLISAKFNKGLEEVKKNILTITKSDNIIEEKNNLKITIIGKPNVGKSSIINKIIKKNKIVTYDEEGTTKDILHINTNIEKKYYTLIDTPGIRYINNKNLITNISNKRSIDEIKKSNIVLFITDIKSCITKQDLNIIKINIKLGKPIILIINKADLCDKNDLINIENNIKKKLSFAKFISYHFLSAKYNFGIKNIIKKIIILDNFQKEEYSTSYFKKIIKKINILLKNKNIKIYYCKISNYIPFTINIYYKRSKNIQKNYKKHITNYILSKMNIINIPLKINFKTLNIN